MITTLTYLVSNKRERRREEVIGEQWTLAFVLSPFKFYHLISECKRFKRERRREAVIGNSGLLSLDISQPSMRRERDGKGR